MHNGIEDFDGRVLVAPIAQLLSLLELKDEIGRSKRRGTAP